MRTVQRATARARLPVKYSQGFNPRPKISLVLARPVAVASRCELLTVEFGRELAGEDWPECLDRHLPEGIGILRAEPMRGRRAPQVMAAAYELPLDSAAQGRAEDQQAKLARQDRWEVTRKTKASRRRDGTAKTIDIKPCIRDLAIEDGRLTFAIAAAQDGSARPAEVLALLGLIDEQPPQADGPPRPAGSETLAKLTRTRLDVQF